MIISLVCQSMVVVGEDSNLVCGPAGRVEKGHESVAWGGMEKMVEV